MTIFITLVTTTDDSSFLGRMKLCIQAKLPELTRASKTLSFMEIYIAHNESRKNVEEM
jgi:hypothetical protein